MMGEAGRGVGHALEAHASNYSATITLTRLVSRPFG
jgi:hypothetical protein